MNKVVYPAHVIKTSFSDKKPNDETCCPTKTPIKIPSEDRLYWHWKNKPNVPGTTRGLLEHSQAADRCLRRSFSKHVFHPRERKSDRRVQRQGSEEGSRYREFLLQKL